MVGNDNGKVRSNRTSNRKLDEIKGILQEISEKLDIGINISKRKVK